MSAAPPAQRRFATAERLPLPDFPIPAYRPDRGPATTCSAAIQFSSGCPYRCEFCDIPALYGRQPRLKEPKQVLAELDAMLARGPLGAVYFVDDNFIGNKKAARELLPHLIEWQKRRGYPIQLRLRGDAQHRATAGPPGDDAGGLFHHRVLRHRDAGAAARSTRCEIAQPGDAAARRVETINRHGMEVVSGIILGLDTDTPATAGRT